MLILSEVFDTLEELTSWINNCIGKRAEEYGLPCFDDELISKVVQFQIISIDTRFQVIALIEVT